MKTSDPGTALPRRHASTDGAFEGLARRSKYAVRTSLYAPSQSASDHAGLGPHLDERPDRLVEIVARVGCRDLAADPRLALRHHRKPEAGHEDAFVEQH